MCVLLHSVNRLIHTVFFPLEDVDLKKRVDESSHIQRIYRHYFDLTIVNDNLEATFKTLESALEELYSEPQWVPVNWVY